MNDIFELEKKAKTCMHEHSSLNYQTEASYIILLGFMTASLEIGQSDIIALDFHTNGLCKL